MPDHAIEPVRLEIKDLIHPEYNPRHISRKTLISLNDP